jgi:hypothetical protein
VVPVVNPMSGGVGGVASGVRVSWIGGKSILVTRIERFSLMKVMVRHDGYRWMSGRGRWID